MILSLFYLLIFTITLGQIGRFSLGSGVVIYISDILLTVVILAWIVKNIYYNDFNAYKKYLTLPICFFIIACLVSLLVNFKSLQILEFIFSKLYLVRWVMYSLVFFIVCSFNVDVKKNILKILIISQVLFIALGLIQYTFYPDLRNLYYLGWDDHLFRLFSTFLDPNFAAAQINLFIFMILSLTLTRNFLSIKYKKILLTILILSFISLILTYSRSGYLMFTFGVSANLWLMNKKRLIVFALSVLVLGITLVPKDLGSAGVELWRTASINARSKSAQQALTIIKDNPIFGVGFNSYRYTQKRYGFIDEETWESTHSGAGTDNSFLFVFATAGLIGILTYLYMWIVIFRQNNVKYKKDKNQSLDSVFPVIITSSVIGIFINALFINSLFYPSIMFWMWTILGLGNLEKTKK